jgi:hypothetical protein
MAREEASDQPAPRLTWRSFAELFEEAWQREQRRRRWWLLAVMLLVAAGVLTAALTGGGGKGSPGRNIAAFRSHVSQSSAPGSSSSVRSRFAVFNQPPASPQAVRRSIRNHPAFAGVLTGKHRAAGLGHAATHIVHTAEGTVWVLTGSGLTGAVRANGTPATFNGAAACLLIPGSGDDYQSLCAPLMGHNAIGGTSGGVDGRPTISYGLVTNSVKRVIVSYASGRTTTVPVVDNTFLAHVRGTMQQCLSRRETREEIDLSTTAKTLTIYCRD